MYDELTIREANVDDELLLLEWRNEESVRKAAFNSEIISLEDHKKWFQKKIQDFNCLILILQKKGKDIGQIRFDITPSEEADVSVSIVKEERRKGYGNAILMMGSNYLFMKYPKVKKVTSLIKENNAFSLKAFLKSGFKFIDRIHYKGHMAFIMVLERTG